MRSVPRDCCRLWNATAAELTTRASLACRRLCHNAFRMCVFRAIKLSAFQCLGHRGSPNFTAVNSMVCEAQVVETSGFEQLQSIYTHPCYLDRCAGPATVPNPRKSGQVSYWFHRQVVLCSYNFDYSDNRRGRQADRNPLRSRGSEGISWPAAYLRDGFARACGKCPPLILGC